MRLASGLLWTLAGTGLPLVAAVVAIPPLVESMGVARFGILSLAWVIAGYFSLFDLGLGRALTQLVAQKIGMDREGEIPSVVWSGTGLMALFGIAGGALLWGLSSWLVLSELKIPEELRHEALMCFHLLAISVPIVILTSALRGVLEARQRFDVVNIIRAPSGVLNYLGPVALLPHTNSLGAMVAVLLGLRLIGFLAHCTACLRLYPELARPMWLDMAAIKPMLSFGGWMTLSNVAAPLLLYLGRFVLALQVSAEAVAYFSTPYDVVVNLLLIPGIFVSVLFPVFTQQFRSNFSATATLYRTAMKQILWIMLPVSALTYILARPALAWWINPEFAEQSYRVAELIAVGVFINSFGHLSQSLVQAFGRPDLTAKLHVVEFALYVPYLVWLIDRAGLEGAAIAWVVRVSLSTVALWALAARCLAGQFKSRY